MQDQDKKLMVVEARIGIPVEGFNSLGQTTILRDFIKELRLLGHEHRAIVVLDNVTLA